MADRTSEVQYIDLDEFRELGILQEVNRRFFHPLGLAMAVAVEDETGKTVAIAGIIDSRDDPEGFRYGFDGREEDVWEKAMRFERMQEEAHARRRETLGYVVQPLPVGFEEAEQE